jgi:hypothetical protein
LPDELRHSAQDGDQYNLYETFLASSGQPDGVIEYVPCHCKTESGKEWAADPEAKPSNTIRERSIWNDDD